MKNEWKDESPAEIVALIRSDIEPVEEAINEVCVLYGDEETG
jgi:hypothetical protein